MSELITLIMENKVLTIMILVFIVNLTMSIFVGFPDDTWGA